MLRAHRKKDEADTLQREICQVEDLILQLQERRLALLQRLNSVQASTASLPPETLSLVFEYASLQDYSYVCPSTPAHAFPHRQEVYPAITFSHVSWHWRQIAWSTPQLWNRMGVEVSKTNADSICHILELHLRNSKALPFNLNLIFGFYSEDALQSTIGPVLSNSEYCRKIRTLQLTNPLPEWLSAISASCPQLECLSINRSFLPWRRRLSLESATLLRHVRLRQVSAEVVLPWSSITHVSLLLVSIDTCAKLLTLCPNLIYFRSASPRRVTAEFTPPTHITALRQLQTLLWTCTDVPWCPTIFQCISLPALRTLSWIDRTLQRETQSCVQALFTHLPDTLLNLELAYIRHWSLPSFRYTFSQCLHVQALTMGSCDVGSLYAAFCALCPGWEGDGTEYLPYVRSLVVHDCHSTNDEPERALSADFSLRTLDICRAKHAGSHLWFTLEFKGLEVDWTPSVRDELRGMVWEGFQLDILEDNVRVEWLP